MRRRIYGLFDKRAHNYGHHCGKVADQIDQIQNVKRPIGFHQRGHPVDHRKGYLLVVDGQKAGAGRDQEYDDGKAKQAIGLPFFTRRIGDVQDDHEHGKRQKDRAKIGNPIGHQRGFQARRNRETGIADIHDQYRGKQHNKPRFLLRNQKEATYKQQERKDCRHTVDNGQIGAFLAGS